VIPEFSGQMVSGQVIPLFERFDFLKGSWSFKSDNEILAWIEGFLNGKYKKVEFPCRREKKE